MSFVRILVDSFTLLKKCPRFYIPKILIAFLFLPSFILFSQYVLQARLISLSDVTAVNVPELEVLLFNLFATLAYVLLVNFVDSFFVNPMYPVMVQQYYGERKISFKKALVQVLHRFKTIFPALLFITLVIIGALAPFMYIVLNAFWIDNQVLLYLAIGAALIAAFFVLTITYLFYPIGSLERMSFANVIGKTLRASFKHRYDVVKALTVSLLISALSFFLAFLIELFRTPDQLLPMLGVFTLFIGMRVVIDVFVTYQYVLNAVFYLGLEKGVFLGK